jgi:hypothetical protein
MMKKCGDYPAECSVTRIVFSSYHEHFAIYNNRQSDMPDEALKEWIDRLSNLKIITKL